MDSDLNDIDDLTFAAKEGLQGLTNSILLTVIRDEIDLKILAQDILIKRGISLSKGVWVGYSAANLEIAKS